MTLYPRPAGDDPPSPCVRRCTLNEAGEMCIGCRRTIGEILSWRDLTPDRKRAVLARIAAEKSAPGKPALRG